MKEQDEAPRYDRDEIVFRAGGTRVLKIAGIIACLIGFFIIRTLCAQSGDSADNPLVKFIGPFWIIAGVMLLFYKSERRFNLASRRWRVLKSVLWFRKHQEGSFSDLAAVEVDCYRGHSVSENLPYIYEVKVTGKDGYTINIRRDIALAHTAFYIATELSEKLFLPLENKAAGKDSIIEMIPEDNVKEPPRRFSTSSFDGYATTFSVPPRMKLAKERVMPLMIPIALYAIFTLGMSAFIARDFWNWLKDCVETGKIKNLWGGLISIPLIILLIFALYWMVNRVFGSRETLKVSPSGVTHRVIRGPWPRERKIPKAEITAIKVRLDTFAPKPWVRDIIICAGTDTILVGDGLPDEENLWIASQLRKILCL